MELKTNDERKMLLAFLFLVSLFRFEQTINDENTLEVFSIFQLTVTTLKKSRQIIDCFANVYMYLLRFSSVKNHVTHSNAITDVIFQWQLTSAGARFQNCDFVVSYNTIF